MKKVIDEMSRLEKLRYFCSGYVTVGTIAQVYDKKLVTSYVAKIRGHIVGESDTFRHVTQEAARLYGKEIQNKWRED